MKLQRNQLWRLNTIHFYIILKPVNNEPILLNSLNTIHFYIILKRYNSRVDWYAKGGLFNAASVIGVGEAGKEAVLPLTNKQAMKSIADSITGNMPDGSIGLGKEEMTQAVTQGVAMAMMNMNTGGNSSPQYISNTINLDGRAIAKAVTKAQNDNNRRKNPSPAW